MAGPWDDLEELHALAAKIGMRREWFQDKPWPGQHYDVTAPKRLLAIRAGAVPVSARDLATAVFTARRSGQDHPLAPAELGLPGPATLF
jgi:hypothetical protein